MLQTSPRNNLHMLSNTRPTSSSTRTTRVLEELQENLEMIQKDIKTTRIQLETVRENKENSEKENEAFIEDNKQLRSDIQEVMQILESKQQLLDSTKKSYVSTENRVKQLKDEAMNSRKELDDLKRREHAIEKECDTIKILKEKQAIQRATLDKQVAQLKAEFDKELSSLKDELESVKLEIENLNKKDITKLVKETVEKQAKEREELVKEFNKVQQQIQLNNQEFINHVKNELLALLDQLPTDQQQSLEEEVNNCKQDVESLVSRIKLNSTT